MKKLWKRIKLAAFYLFRDSTIAMDNHKNPTLRSMVKAAKGSPMVMEHVQCTCGKTRVVFHRFESAFSCVCGKMVPSQVK